MDAVRCLLLSFVCTCYVSCMEENVAVNKNTSTTSGSYPDWPPSRAVDGNHVTLNSGSSCFHSTGTPSDWTVDLGREYQLYNVKVYFRTGYNYRTANSSIYVDNDPSRVCYTFPSTIPDNPTQLTCNETARYVTIMNPGNEGDEDSLNICEVEIYACALGYRGLLCDNSCNCDECDRWTGVCYSTCPPGWEGERCVIACNGTYGSNCSNFCAARHCSNSLSSCDRVNGTCDSRCLAGYTGHDCTSECPSSMYGLSCSENCMDRHCINNSTCDHRTGSCDQGCEPGWKSLDCTEECTEGEEYGPNCSGSCGARHCLNQSSCHPANGLCENGCETGWEGLQCLQAVRIDADVAGASESPSPDARIIALSTAVGVLVVIIIILSVLLARKFKKQASDKSAYTTNRSTPDASSTPAYINTDITSSNTTSSTATSTYETLQLTEDNHYTGLSGRKLYENA